MKNQKPKFLLAFYDNGKNGVKCGIACAPDFDDTDIESVIMGLSYKMPKKLNAEYAAIRAIDLLANDDDLDGKIVFDLFGNIIDPKSARRR